MVECYIHFREDRYLTQALYGVDSISKAQRIRNLSFVSRVLIVEAVENYESYEVVIQPVSSSRRSEVIHC